MCDVTGGRFYFQLWGRDTYTFTFSVQEPCWEVGLSCETRTTHSSPGPSSLCGAAAGLAGSWCGRAVARGQTRPGWWAGAPHSTHSPVPALCNGTGLSEDTEQLQQLPSASPWPKKYISVCGEGPREKVKALSYLGLVGCMGQPAWPGSQTDKAQNSLCPLSALLRPGAFDFALFWSLCK